MKYWLVIILFLVISCQTTAKQPLIPDPSDTKFWSEFHEEWIGLDSDKYRIYVFHNINEFNAAPVDIKRQGIEKWQAFYPQDPWPPDNQPPKRSAFPKPTGNQMEESAEFIIEGVLQKIAWDYLW